MAESSESESIGALGTLVDMPIVAEYVEDNESTDIMVEEVVANGEDECNESEDANGFAANSNENESIFVEEAFEGEESGDVGDDLAHAQEYADEASYNDVLEGSEEAVPILDDAMPPVENENIVTQDLVVESDIVGEPEIVPSDLAMTNAAGIETQPFVEEALQAPTINTTGVTSVAAVAVLKRKKKLGSTAAKETSVGSGAGYVADIEALNELPTSLVRRLQTSLTSADVMRSVRDAGSNALTCYQQPRSLWQLLKTSAIALIRAELVTLTADVAATPAVSTFDSKVSVAPSTVETVAIASTAVIAVDTTMDGTSDTPATIAVETESVTAAVLAAMPVDETVDIDVSALCNRLLPAETREAYLSTCVAATANDRAMLDLLAEHQPTMCSYLLSGITEMLCDCVPPLLVSTPALETATNNDVKEDAIPVVEISSAVLDTKEVERGLLLKLRERLFPQYAVPTPSSVITSISRTGVHRITPMRAIDLPTEMEVSLRTTIAANLQQFLNPALLPLTAVPDLIEGLLRMLYPASGFPASPDFAVASSQLQAHNPTIVARLVAILVDITDKLPMAQCAAESVAMRAHQLQAHWFTKENRLLRGIRPSGAAACTDPAFAPRSARPPPLPASTSPVVRVFNKRGGIAVSVRPASSRLTRGASVLNAIARGGSNAMGRGGSNAMGRGGSNSMSRGGSNAMGRGGSNAMGRGGFSSARGGFPLMRGGGAMGRGGFNGGPSPYDREPLPQRRGESYGPIRGDMRVARFGSEPYAPMMRGPPMRESPFQSRQMPREPYYNDMPPPMPHGRGGPSFDNRSGGRGGDDRRDFYQGPPPAAPQFVPLLPPARRVSGGGPSSPRTYGGPGSSRRDFGGGAAPMEHRSIPQAPMARGGQRHSAGAQPPALPSPRVINAPVRPMVALAPAAGSRPAVANFAVTNFATSRGPPPATRPVSSGGGGFVGANSSVPRSKPAMPTPASSSAVYASAKQQQRVAAAAKPVGTALAASALQLTSAEQELQALKREQATLQRRIQQMQQDVHPGGSRPAINPLAVMPIQQAPQMPPATRAPAPKYSVSNHFAAPQAPVPQTQAPIMTPQLQQQQQQMALYQQAYAAQQQQLSNQRAMQTPAYPTQPAATTYQPQQVPVTPQQAYTQTNYMSTATAPVATPPATGAFPAYPTTAASFGAASGMYGATPAMTPPTVPAAVPGAYSYSYDYASGQYVQSYNSTPAAPVASQAPAVTANQGAAQTNSSDAYAAYYAQMAAQAHATSAGAVSSGGSYGNPAATPDYAAYAQQQQAAAAYYQQQAATATAAAQQPPQQPNYPQQAFNPQQPPAYNPQPNYSQYAPMSRQQQ